MYTHERNELVSSGIESKDTANGMDIDEILTLLSNSRRRAMMRVMIEHERLDFGELVDRVAEIEYRLPLEEISSDERHNIYVSLYQSHKPKLEDAGALESERDTGTVTLGENADALVPWFDKIDGRDTLTGKLRSAFA